jgi:hypothetical protein
MNIPHQTNPKQNNNLFLVKYNYKITKAGQLCRHCSTPVIERIRSDKPNPKKAYYFLWWFLCPKCYAIYHVDAAKRYFDRPEEPILQPEQKVADPNWVSRPEYILPWETLEDYLKRSWSLLAASTELSREVFGREYKQGGTDRINELVVLFCSDPDVGTHTQTA